MKQEKEKSPDGRIKKTKKQKGNVKDRPTASWPLACKRKRKKNETIESRNRKNQTRASQNYKGKSIFIPVVVNARRTGQR